MAGEVDLPLQPALKHRKLRIRSAYDIMTAWIGKMKARLFMPGQCYGDVCSSFHLNAEN